MCIQLQEFFESCCHMTQRLLYCGDGSAPCPASKIHTFTDYLTTGTCSYCNLGVRTRSAIAALRKEVSLTPDVNPVPEKDRAKICEEWRKNTKAFHNKRRLRDDFIVSVAVNDIEEERQQCTYCWRQFDGTGDDCCENPKKLFCGHIFGYRCVLEWLFYSGKHWCPTCRKGFDKPRDGATKNKRHGVIIDPEAWPEGWDLLTENQLFAQQLDGQQSMGEEQVVGQQIPENQLDEVEDLEGLGAQPAAE